MVSGSKFDPIRISVCQIKGIPNIPIFLLVIENLTKKNKNKKQGYLHNTSYRKNMLLSVVLLQKYGNNRDLEYLHDELICIFVILSKKYLS